MNQIHDDNDYLEGLSEQLGPRMDVVPQQVHENKGDDTLLVELVAQYPVLYNKQLKEYKNNVIRETCWGKISEILQKSAPDCLKRWNQLRESYGREKRRREDECRSGSGSLKRKGFHLFNDMTFLEQHIQRRKTYTNVSTSSTTDTFAPKDSVNYLKQVCVSQQAGFQMPLSVPAAANFRIPTPLTNSITPTQLSTMPPVTVSAEMLLSTTLTQSPPSSRSPDYHEIPATSSAETFFDMPAPSTDLIMPQNSFQTPASMSSVESSCSVPSPSSTPPPPLIMPQNSFQTPASMPSVESSCSVPPPTSTPTAPPSLIMPQNSFQTPASMSSVESFCSMPLPTPPSTPTPPPPLTMPQNSLRRPASMSSVESFCSVPSPTSPSTPTPPRRISTTQCSEASRSKSTSRMKNNYKENEPSSNYARPKSCYAKEGGKSKNIDPIEESFLQLSTTLQSHFQNSIRKEDPHKQPTPAEHSFGNLIAMELEAIPEPMKSSKKVRILQVLYEQQSSS